ncbi:MAG TPA: FecR domain-containing protein, partial [Blastocatellia bacterium]|nr:FecR domain-containing protein [Blastocatellia bacterium]
MFAELRKRVSSVSPRVAVVVGLLIAFAAGSGVALLLMRDGESVDADDRVQPIAARIDRVDGSVGIARVIDENTEPDWEDATINTPVSVGDRIYTRENSRASVALTGRNFVRLDPGASLDVLELGDETTHLALRDGSAIFDVGALEENAFYEVGTPYGAVDFAEPGLYQIGIDDNNAIISVLSGLAQVIGTSGSGYINKGEVYTLAGAAASEVVASTLAPSLAGGIVDDYYSYRHPSVYDGRYRTYDTYVSDPFYYDTYRNSASYRYVSADIPGLHDLDYYGDWTNIDGYGHCWAPRVGAGWAP